MFLRGLAVSNPDDPISLARCFLPSFVSGSNDELQFGRCRKPHALRLCKFPKGADVDSDLHVFVVERVATRVCTSVRFNTRFVVCLLLSFFPCNDDAFLQR